MKLRGGTGARLLLAFAVGCGGRATAGDLSEGVCASDLACPGAEVCSLGRCVAPSIVPPFNTPPNDLPSQGSSGDMGVSNGAPADTPVQPAFPCREGDCNSPSATSGEEPAAMDGDIVSFTRAIQGVEAIVSDLQRERFYVAVGSSPFADAAYANSLLTLDPVTANPLHVVSMGDNPDSLAISDDGSTLWVGIHDEYAIRKVDLTGEWPSPGPQYPLPFEAGYATVHAKAMVVVPGTTSTLAVALHVDVSSPSFAGLILLDDGVPRPVLTPGHTGATRLTPGPPGYLFGYDQGISSFPLYVISIHDDGLTQREHEGYVSEFGTDMRYQDGYLFATSGEIVDVRAPERPAAAGRYPRPGAVLPELALGRVWMLSPADATLGTVTELIAFTPRAMTSVEQYAIGVDAYSPRQLVRSPGGVFGFIAEADQENPGIFGQGWVNTILIAER